MRGKLRSLALAFAAAALTALAIGSAAQAATQFKLIGAGQDRQAFAAFDSTSGCIDTSVVVVGINGKSAGFTMDTGGGHTSGPASFIDVSQYDHCAGQPVLDAGTPCCGGPLPAGDSVAFAAARDDSSATLDARLTVVDSLSGASIPLTAHLAWTATGPLERDSFSEVPPGGGLPIEVAHGEITHRPAIATGTVTDGATNYTPDPSTEADISSTISSVFVHIGPCC